MMGIVLDIQPVTRGEGEIAASDILPGIATIG